jgi:ribosomal protein S27AE
MTTPPSVIVETHRCPRCERKATFKSITRVYEVIGGERRQMAECAKCGGWVLLPREAPAA